MSTQLELLPSERFATHAEFDVSVPVHGGTDRLSLWDIPEEIANSITHGIGLALALMGGAAMMLLALRIGDGWQLAGCGIYVASVVAVYAASTLSHAFQEPRRKRLFRMIDQGCIYLMIAGTYTPFGLVHFRDGWGALLLATMWGAALIGFLSKVVLAHRVEAISLTAYIVLGWLPVVAVYPMLEVVPLGALWWMLAGGLCYTAGTAFLTLDERVPFFHSVWHVLVIAGSALHYLAILFYVLLLGV